MTIQEAILTERPFTRPGSGWTWRILISKTGSCVRYWQRKYVGWTAWEDSGGPWPDDILASDLEIFRCLKD